MYVSVEREDVEQSRETVGYIQKQQIEQACLAETGAMLTAMCNVLRWTVERAVLEAG